MLEEILNGIVAMGPSLFLVFLRVGACMALLPAFGEQVVSVRVRLAATLAFTILLWPLVQADFPTVTRDSQFLSFAGAEIITGLLLGLSFRLFVQALQIAGTIAGSSTSLAQVFGGGVGIDPQPAIGNTMVLGALALAAMSGLHVRCLEAFVLSYDAVPAGQWPDPMIVKDWTIQEVASAFSLAFVLSSPFLVAALLYNLALGVINRAMPQLMVSFVGAPALTLGGLAIGAITLPFLLLIWIERFHAVLSDPFGIGY